MTANGSRARQVFWEGHRRRSPGRSKDRGPGPPYAATTATLVGILFLSQALPWAKRAFGGNVPPLFARLSPSIGVALLAPLALAVVAWLAAPRILGTRTALFLLAVVAFGWLFAIALASQSGGLDAISAPFRSRLDYYANVPLVDVLGPRTFAERYPDLTGRLSLHAATHPPGAALFLWMVSKAAGGSLLSVSLVVALAGAAGAVPTYWLARSAYGEADARLAAVLFAAAPGVLLYSATSMDAVFMTVTAVALAAAMRAPTSDGWAVATGALTAIALSFTFGAAVVGLVALGVGLLAWRTTPALALLRRAVAVLAGLGMGAVALRWGAGIDLVASFRAALDAHLSDPSRSRPYWYWVVANLPAFLIAAGIVQTALLADETRHRWRERRPGLETVLWASLVAASATGLFKGEVDHIWLMFIPVLAASAGAALLRRQGSGAHQAMDPAEGGPAIRLALIASLVQAVLMEVLLFTFW